ncbi:MAG: peptidase [Candidatus Omnitrophica bacterium 4484_70.1]|nr:MAG: peptidase [Candidatus Omnitrophica bacterium 4484_70.1]
MWSLKFKMSLLLIILFSIIYAGIAIIGTIIGIANFYFYLVISLALMFFQYMIGPRIVEWQMRIKYIEGGEYLNLQRMVEELSQKAGIPKPKIGIAKLPIPNAFAFGRSLSDGRVCVTEGILQLLNEEELKAVLGHEITHLKNRDVLFITILSVIPLLLYHISWHLFWFGGGRRREQGGNIALVGAIAFLFYFITNLLVLYASRIREYFADKGAVYLGNKPSTLASALYKLVYASAQVDKESLKKVGALKAFFLNDPHQAVDEIQELSQIDIDKSGTIDPYELEALRRKKINLRFSDRLLEILTTHPNMLKRIKQLSQYQQLVS